MSICSQLRILLILSTISLSLHAQESLRVMAWNVFMLPPPIKFTKQKVRTKLQINALKSLVNENDVLVLTETFQGRYKKKLLKELEEFYPYYYIQKRKAPFYKIMPSRVMILSRFPLKFLGETYYNRCAKADCFATKAALLVELTMQSGAKVQLLATHMQSGEGPKIQMIRKSQLARIKELLNDFQAEGVPQIVAGDLNINSSKGDEFEEMRLFLNLNPLSEHLVTENTKSEDVHCFGLKYDGFEKTIDHILLKNNGADVRLTEERIFPLKGLFSSKYECDLSDHHPVQSLVVFNSRLPSSVKKTFRSPLLMVYPNP